MVLFDEIEKADAEVYNLLLQILDEGILTDSTGRKCDFKNSIIIMTSNIGAKFISNNTSIGFAQGSNNDRENDRIRDVVLKEAKNHFKPEFLNRIDEMIVFKSLDAKAVGEITERMLSELSKRCLTSNIVLNFKDSAVNKLSTIGFDSIYGARPLRRAISHNIEDPLAEKFLKGEIHSGGSCTVSFENEKFIFDIK